MSRSSMIVFLSAIFVLAFALPTLHAEMKAPEKDMMLTLPEGKGTQPTVNFSHQKHASVNCTDCHHKWDQKSEVKKCSDSGCHDVVWGEKNGKKVVVKKGENAFYSAFHSKKGMSCLTCHKNLKKAKKPGGPTACSKCHVKNKS